MSKPRRGSAQRQAGGKSDINQLGIFAMPEIDADSDVDDNDLEAELMSILSSDGGGSARPSEAKRVKSIPLSNLDQMIATSLRDTPSGDESSGDEDDPSLLAELERYTGGKVASSTVSAPTESQESTSTITLLNERLLMYKDAEANAKTLGDTAKARRLSRGLKTLEDLLRKAKSGTTIDESEIPLPVSVKKPSSDPSPQDTNEDKPPPVPPRRSIAIEPEAPKQEQTMKPVDTNMLKVLQERRDEYKRAAVTAKRSGDLETAKAHIRLIKQFENVIAGVERGDPFDLSSMPPPPPPSTRPDPVTVSTQPVVPTGTPSSPQVVPPAPPPVIQEPPQATDVSSGKTVLEALEERLDVFRKQEEKAKLEGNSSKVRRMGRIAKQYEDAIKLHKAGKEFPLDDLPTPPGFGPIPVEPKNPPSPRTSGASDSLLSPGVPADGPPRSASPKPTSSRPPSPSPSSVSTASSVSPKASGRTTRQEKQLAILLKRQKEWKEAAIAAKKSGDMVKAKECLRQVKGFDPLIEASQSGLPVDLATIPVPPKDKVENDFEIVEIRDCLPGTNSEIYEQLKTDLKEQFKMCMETRLHYKTLGDVGNSNKFEQLGVDTKKDLDRVSVLHDRDDPVPRYHYEMRTFSIVRSNTDLNDNDLELSIIQGVNYNVPNPKEIDTYVRYEFPFPSEDPKRDKTSTVYNTNNPEYNSTYVIPIVRTSRACQRVFKRHSLKLEVWSKGGFLRSDSLVGTVNVKLQPLETKSTIHDSFNLMDGRKPVGGKLEVKLRLRHPIQEKEFETVKKKWLIID